MSTSVLPSSTAPISFSGCRSSRLTSRASVAFLLQRVHAGARGRRQRRLAAVEERRQQQQHDDGREDERDFEGHGSLGLRTVRHTR